MKSAILASDQSVSSGLKPGNKKSDGKEPVCGETPKRRPRNASGNRPYRNGQLVPVTWSLVLRNVRGHGTIFGENVNGKNLNGQVVEDNRDDLPVCSTFSDFPVVPDVSTARPKSNTRKLPKPNNGAWRDR